MIKFIKFFQLLSIIVFLPVLIFVYAYLPEQVAVSSDPSVRMGTMISREVFFYTALIVFAISNLLCISLGRALQHLPARQSFSGETLFYNPSSKNSIIAWLKSFCIVLNSFFIFGTIYIGVLNNEEALRPTTYNFLLYIGPLLILIWLLLLLFIILRPPKNYQFE